MPTVKQYKDALRKHNQKHCVKLTGTKSQLAQRARDKNILVRLKKHKSSKTKKQSTYVAPSSHFEEIDDKIRMAKLAKAKKKAKAQQLARAKQGSYNRVFGDM